VKGGWSGVDAPDVLGVWTALAGLEDEAGGGGGRDMGRDNGGAPGGVWVWAPFTLLEVVDADADATEMAGEGAAVMPVLPALVVPLLLPLLVVARAVALLLAFPLEDLKEDKRFCAEDLRRIEGQREFKDAYTRF